MSNLPSRKRSKQVKIYLSDDEYSKFLEKVEKSNLSQTDYFVKCVTGKKITVIEGLTELLSEIKRIGANTNQISKNLNSGIFQGAMDNLKIIKADISKINELIIDVLKEIK